MADRECIICRCISSTEAWSTECSLDDCTRLDQIGKYTILRKLHINRSGCRIYRKCKFVRANVFSTDQVCCLTDILESTTGTACDDSLLYIELSVNNLILQCKVNLAIQGYLRTFFYIVQNIHQICLHVLNCVDIAWVEWHCDHRFYLGEIYINNTVVICNSTRI